MGSRRPVQKKKKKILHSIGIVITTKNIEGYWTVTPPTIRLRKCDKTRQEKVPIALKNVLSFYRQSRYDLKHKGNLVSLQVQTSHFGIWENPKQEVPSCGKKKLQKINLIDNNPLSIIVTLLTIYWEVIPLTIGVWLITPWKMFTTLGTGTAVAEFNDIVFKASGKTLKFIPADFNEKICIAVENSECSQGTERKKRKAEAGKVMLPSNLLIFQLYTNRYTPSTGKVSSWKYGYLECLGYSDPIYSRWVKSI